jgi:hypothetical protein
MPHAAPVRELSRAPTTRPPKNRNPTGLPLASDEWRAQIARPIQCPRRCTTPPGPFVTEPSFRPSRRISWRRLAVEGLAALASVLLASTACAAPEEPSGSDGVSALPGDPPDIIVVLVDDLRWDEFGIAGHPYAETPNIDRLGVEGAVFSNAFHAVPLCSPNRASLLTGQYPSRHGIIDNVARNLASHRLETFPQALQASGYETAFLGKWHMGNDPTPRPGFDTWAALPGQGRTINPILFEDGQAQEVTGYVTDILTDRAVRFISRERQRPHGLHPGASSPGAV